MIYDIKVTILVPIHNSEKYLRECLQSALMQTFREIEILCINSGNADSSLEIIRELQKTDSRIVYIQDSNTGYGHKLNVGIDRARGRYIAILESDDRLCPNMIERLYKIAEAYRADIADADYYELFKYREREYKRIKYKYENKEMYNCLLSSKSMEEKTCVYSGIWTALYRREFLKNQNIRLNESAGASFQDMSFMFITSLLADSVYHLNVPLYQYRIDNMDSSVKNDKKVFEIIDECEFLKQDLMKRGISDKAVWKLYYIRKYNSFYWNYCRLSPKSKELFLEKYLDELRRDMQNEAINNEMFQDYLYNRTFLLVDNKDKFVKMVAALEVETWGEKFCSFLHEMENRNVIIFGAGRWGTKLIDILQQNENNIRGICDNSKTVQGTLKNGFIVISVEAAVKQFPDALYVVVNQMHADEMRDQLIEYGIDEKNIKVMW